MTTMATQTRASGRPRTGHFSGKYQVLGDIQLSAEEEAVVQQQMEQLEREPLPVSTALRWGRQQLDLVRRAAALAGVPYQTYLKMAAIRAAINDLRVARDAGVETP
jgi:predicted DNA binding CopG/RHH family protein